MFITKELFSVSTYTFTTEIQFKNFSIENLSIIKTGTESSLQLDNQFSTLTLVNFPPARNSYGMSYSTTSNKIFLFGGEYITLGQSPIYRNDSWLFDCSNNSWQQVYPVTKPSERCGHCVVNCGDEKFFVFGGFGTNGIYFNDTYIYNLSNNTFQEITVSTSPSPRAYFGTCYVKDYNRIYLFGGIGKFLQEPETKIFNDLWYYDIDNSSWVCVVTSCSVEKIYNHKMVYVPSQKNIYIFGGAISDVTFSSAVWKYNVEAASFSFVGFAPFSGIHDFGMTYFEYLDRILVLFGQKYDSGYSISNDFYFYDVNINSWTKNTQPYLNLPLKRRSFEIVSSSHEVILYGGLSETGTSLSTTHKYKYSSSGNFITQSFYPSISNPTKFSYKKISYSPIQQLSGTKIKFQIANSVDGVNFSQFLGPNDNPASYYEYDYILDISSTNNNKFIKIKGILETTKIPNNPYFDELEIIYNWSPYPTTLSFPLNQTSTNTLTPEFYWLPGTDPEDDSVFTYRLQISRTTDFVSLVINQAGISDTKYKIGTNLSTGKYYWRVATKDSYDEGEFSGYYELEIDTTPPNKPYGFNATTGDENGKINFWCNISGDDGDKNMFNGKVLVAYSSWSVIDTEEKFNSSNIVEFFVNNKNPGDSFGGILSGLLDNTTYFLNIRLRDDAGNLSEISTSAICAITNFSPEVHFVFPTTGIILSSSVTLGWNYSDYNQGDTHNISLFISKDGTNYNSIVLNLPNGTTKYVWNTFSVRNGTYYLKVVCRDNKGLEGVSIINNVKVENPNLPPKILSWIFPKHNNILSGKTTISWELYDPNLQDTHTYRLYISTDNNIFNLVTEILFDTTSYLFDTTKYFNYPSYRLKLFVTDGEFDDELVSEQFQIKNENLPPTEPVLIFPPNNSYVSPLKIKFSWKNSVDKNEGDIVVYDFYLSTHPSAETYFVSKTTISATEFEITYPTITELRTYYWYVIARDLFCETSKSEVYRFTTYPKSKSVSNDNQVYVEMMEGFDEKFFIFVEKICDDKRQLSSVQLADSKDTIDRTTKIIPYEVYKISLYDENFNEIERELKYKLVFSVDVDKYKTLVPLNTLKIARLDNNSNCWVFTEYKQELEQKKVFNLNNENNITTYSNKFGLFTVIARTPIEIPVSNIKIYPNPCNVELEDIKIEYLLTENLDVRIQILTLSGGLVKEFFYPAGTIGKSCGVPEGMWNGISWDGKNEIGMTVANGMYVCKMIFGNKVEQRNIAILKR